MLMNLEAKSLTTSDKVSTPNANLKLTVPKRHYSLQREDSLKCMPTPVFDKSRKMKRDGPSSPKTVLTMAGLFVVGVTLVLSGIIVACQHQEGPFLKTGCIFLGVGFSMLFSCAVLQRKNIIKYVKDLDRDLYFLNMSESYMWKMMFEERHKLPIIGSRGN